MKKHGTSWQHKRIEELKQFITRRNKEIFDASQHSKALASEVSILKQENKLLSQALSELESELEQKVAKPTKSCGFKLFGIELTIELWKD